MLLKEFIKQNGMLIDYAYFEKNLDMFVNEMNNGLAGENSSLKMIPTYISIDDIPEKRDSVIVIDAGGTNLRIALVNFVDNTPSITYFKKYPMLGIKEPVTKNEFFSTLAEYLVPIADKSKKIGFCFSFGRNLAKQGWKGYSAQQGSENRRNCKFTYRRTVKKALAEKGFDIRSTVIINDTVASLLGARVVTANASSTAI